MLPVRAIYGCGSVLRGKMLNKTDQLIRIQRPFSAIANLPNTFYTCTKTGHSPKPTVSYQLVDGYSSRRDSRGLLGGYCMSHIHRRCLSTAAKADCSDPLLHIPVMVKETIDMLSPQNDQVIIDMTFGAGGHTKEILKLAPKARIFTLDRDPLAFSLAQDLAKTCSEEQLTPLLGRFSELHHLLLEHGLGESSVDGVLFDVGTSSMQFDTAERGFSLSKDGPLDMRMDGDRCLSEATAADVVNQLDQAGLYQIIKTYGEERLARLIAHTIVQTRYAFGKITRTKQLADIISMAFQGSHKRDKLLRHSHVATKTFQALRIFVNDELNELNNGLETAWYFLKPGGRCVTLTFHSLEDRIVKRHFHGIVMDSQFNMGVTDQYRNSLKVHDFQKVSALMEKRWNPLSKKVISPCYADCLDNPRSRSSRLRGAVKLL